ncbi:MAG: hypothetical protein NZ954_05070 [Thermofilaceae archaeon]|nr:hypothetical protein [Thermofilaceae archaeon]MCX8180178.1 hypothetical protein [Thermofilaceae archaeon]MDW8004166.1 hypothetical protein [Thermofilaceae archaeon]
MSARGLDVRKLTLVVSVRAGQERRVRRDLLDALYPYDRSIRIDVIDGLIVVYSSLEHEMLVKLLQEFPIRGILRVRQVLLYAEGDSPEQAVVNLMERAAERGYKLAKLEVRSRGAPRKTLETLAVEKAKELGLFSREGIKSRILVLGNSSILCKT